MGPLVRKYVASLGGADVRASVIGSTLKCPLHAALANGIDIHADDYDDTQLSVARTASTDS